MKVSLSNRQRDLPLARRTELLRLLRRTLALTGLSPAPDATAPRAPAPEVAFALVARAAIAALNEQHLHHHGPTDVITFDYRTATGPAASTLADIVVCPALAIAAAPAHHQSAAAETVLYLVHGVLHLTGHDDTTPAARRAMRHAEAHIMTALRAEYDLEALFGEPAVHPEE